MGVHVILELRTRRLHPFAFIVGGLGGIFLLELFFRLFRTHAGMLVTKILERTCLDPRSLDKRDLVAFEAVRFRAARLGTGGVGAVDHQEY